MGKNKPSYLYNPELCPCEKGAAKGCQRFRNCGECIANHRSEGKIQQTACERKATLIVYYSLEGNTDFAAKEIAKVLGYETLRIEPVKKYPEKGPLKFLVGGKGACLAETPRLKPYVFDVNEYARIIFGFPVWAGNITPPIRTFIKENDLQGKKIAAFACQGGAGAEKAFGKLKEALGIGKLEAELILNDPKARPNEGNEKKILDFCDSIKDGLRGEGTRG